MRGETVNTIRTGLAKSLLREIADRLAVLAATGQTHAIDLRALPLTPADHADLAEALGEGEVEVQLHVAGESTVRETGYSGVWWLVHKGDAGLAGEQVAAEMIEICHVPDILLAHPGDIGRAARRLAETLEADTEDSTDEITEARNGE